MSASPQRVEQERPIRIVPQPKSPPDAKVELTKVRRELLTLAERIDKLVKGQAQ